LRFLLAIFLAVAIARYACPNRWANNPWAERSVAAGELIAMLHVAAGRSVFSSGDVRRKIATQIRANQSAAGKYIESISISVLVSDERGKSWSPMPPPTNARDRSWRRHDKKAQIFHF